jgi:hypothetical protein
MRPPSIVNFERLFLAAMALGVICVVVGYEAATAQLARESALRQLGIGGSEMYIGISAAWLVILAAIGAVFFVPALTGRWDLALLLDVAYYALELAAVARLFRADATAWLTGKPDTGQAALD